MAAALGALGRLIPGGIHIRRNELAARREIREAVRFLAEGDYSIRRLVRLAGCNEKTLRKLLVWVPPAEIVEPQFLPAVAMRNSRLHAMPFQEIGRAGKGGAKRRAISTQHAALFLEGEVEAACLKCGTAVDVVRPSVAEGCRKRREVALRLRRSGRVVGQIAAIFGLSERWMIKILRSSRP